MGEVLSENNNVEDKEERGEKKKKSVLRKQDDGSPIKEGPHHKIQPPIEGRMRHQLRDG